MLMKPDEAKEFINIMDRYKKYFGLADYNIRVVPKYKSHDTNLAEVESDHYEKELTVQLFNGFKKLDDNARKKVLVHELIHARFAVYDDKASKATAELEEEFINDVTSGVIGVEDDAKRS
jgi:predicted metallopeptidase